MPLGSILILHSHLRLGLPSNLFPSGFQIEIPWVFLIYHTCANCPRLSHPPCFDNPNNILGGGGIQIMELHTTKLCLSSVQIFSTALRSYTRQTDNQCTWSEVLVLDCSYVWDLTKGVNTVHHNLRINNDHSVSINYLRSTCFTSVFSMYSRSIVSVCWEEKYEVIKENGTKEIYEELHKLQVKCELHSKNNTWKGSYYILVNTHELNSEVPGSILDKFSWFS
jgi:hypothetical protein